MHVLDIVLKHHAATFSKTIGQAVFSSDDLSKHKPWGASRRTPSCGSGIASRSYSPTWGRCCRRASAPLPPPPLPPPLPLPLPSHSPPPPPLP